MLLSFDKLRINVRRKAVNRETGFGPLGAEAQFFGTRCLTFVRRMVGR